ncbi:Crp/Fnr family transcriptional regulator [Pseudorhodoferax sp. Leaf274]|uniref:Crp/Fnr family transcriptional regulator n=1 Tax=Pseudorhodoferax sp. Leaf274 TaxID=1736318 RepID=UPI0007038A40|nr:Crp/Fnr family transcriptional regulator [Pseudorhodoferax sp. Leaf274]KQP49831.1 Crp/Fnr family transcriptional regulator [Pseudorhodoferax sp. Leaf274]
MLTENVLRNRANELSDEERRILEAAVSSTRTYRPGEVVVRQGVAVDISTLLVSGLMTRHVDAADGRRHLVAVHVPGDFVDLHAYALKRLDHDVGALTDITVAVVPHAALEEIQVQHPPLTRRLWFMTLLDAAMHRHWVLRLASLNALQRVAHFLCEMNARLTAIGLSDGNRFALNMTQADIGEVCGLTNVHVNRVLRQLREMGLCSLRAAQLVVHDPRGLAAAGLFEADYLYLNDQTALRAAGQSGAGHG